MPKELLRLPPEEEQYYLHWHNGEGIHVICSVRDEKTIHVSIACLPSVNPSLDLNAWSKLLIAKAPALLAFFFPGRTFYRMPDDMRAPATKHFFHYLQKHEYADYANN